MKKGAIWIDRTIIESPYCVGLCQSEEQFIHELKRMRVKGYDSIEWIEKGKAGQVHQYESSDGSFNRVCIVCIRPRKGRSPSALENLIKINREIKDKTFDVKNWLKAEVAKKKFSYLWGEWIKQKENKLAQGKFAPSSLRTYKYYYRNHFTYFADMLAEEVQLKHIQGFVDGLTCSEKYAKCLVGCLQAFFAWLERWDGTKKPLFPEMELTKKSQKRGLLYAEQVKAIDKIPDKHRDIFVFMRETALRISEGCAIKIKDIAIDKNSVLIQRTYSDNVLSEHTKGRNALWVPLSGIAKEIAEKHAQNRFGEDFLFINQKTGRGYRAASLRRFWNVYSGSGVCVHEGIRHSTISDWSHSANAFQVRELARHSDIRVSQEYVHNAMTDLTNIVNRGNVVEIKKECLE